MKRYWIIDGGLIIPHKPVIPYTSFDSFRRASEFLKSLEEDQVYIRDSQTGRTWWYQDGRIVEETEV